MKVFLGLYLGIFSAQLEAQKMFAPVHGYISVETFEIRKEFVLRLDTVAARLDVNLEKDGGMISSEERRLIEKKAGEWLKGKCPLVVDGARVEMVLDRVHFVRPDPEKGVVIEERESVIAGEALLGVVFAAALDGPVKEVKVKWEVFPADGSAAIVAIGTRQNTATKKVESSSPEIRWQSKGELKVPELLDLPPLVQGNSVAIPMLSAVLILVLLVLIGVAIRHRKRTPTWLSSVMIALATIALVAREKWKIDLFNEPVEVTPELADEVVYALLRNTYRAFDYRKESDVYDVLAKSVDGELLTKVYLEVQKSLQLESQGGARARVYELDLRKCELNDASENNQVSFNARCSWVAIGTVTHWGHTHDRVNRYEAQLSVAVVDGSWKLNSLELLNQERKEKRIAPTRKDTEEGK